MDKILFELIHSYAGRWNGLDTLFVLLSDYAGYALLCVLAFIVWKKRKSMVFIQILLATLLSRGILTEGIRFLWERPRPFAELGFTPLIEHAASASFPSGHAAFYFAISAVVFTYSKRLGALFFVVSIFMGFARVFTGVHWPSDILGGALIGIASGLAVIEFQQRRKEKSGIAA